MKSTLLLPVLFLFLFISCQKDDNSPQTQTVNLQLDGYAPGGNRIFQAGFATGVSAEVTLGPVTNACQVTFIQFLFGGTGTTTDTRDVILRIFDDSGDAIPGISLYSGIFTVASSDINFQQIDLRGEMIMVAAGRRIRVALEMTANGLPSVAIDQDGTITNTSNWIHSGGSWVSSASLGLNGDFIIRAVVVEGI